MTLLSEENAGAAANCNAAGQSFGVFVGYGAFMSLYSPDFCNKWLRSVPQNKGLITASDAILAYSIIFLVITVLVAIFKKEKDLVGVNVPPPMMKTYKTMSRIVFLLPVRQEWSNFTNKILLNKVRSDPDLSGFLFYSL